MSVNEVFCGSAVHSGPALPPTQSLLCTLELPYFLPGDPNQNPSLVRHICHPISHAPTHPCQLHPATTRVALVTVSVSTFVSFLPGSSQNIRRAAILLLTSAAHNKPDLVQPQLKTYMVDLYQQTPLDVCCALCLWQCRPVSLWGRMQKGPYPLSPSRHTLIKGARYPVQVHLETGG